jgi:hypothetical protein
VVVNGQVVAGVGTIDGQRIDEIVKYGSKVDDTDSNNNFEFTD